MQQLTWKISSFGDAYIDELTSGLFEQQPAYDVFERYLNQDIQQQNRLLVVVGSDSGLILPYLTQLAQQNHAFFICYELDEVVKQIRQQGWQDTDKVRLVNVDFDITSLFFDELFTEFFLRQAVNVVPSIAVSTHKSIYLPLWHQVYDSIRASLIKFNTAQSAQFINRHLDNMTELLFPIRLLKDKLSGKTAVMLGGGPSVELIFEWVRQHRDQLVLFAANRISSRLYKEGITPDFFVAVDPQPELLDYCTDMFKFAEHSILLTSASVASNVLLQWPGKMAYGERLTPFYPLREHESQPLNFRGTGPTVMNFAVQAASYMGAKHVIFAGIDLCHSPLGQSHESMSIESSAGQFTSSAEAKILTYAGKMAHTTTQYLLAKNIFQEQVAVWSERTQFWQINPNAAVIDGVILLDLNTQGESLLVSAQQEMTTIHQALSWSSLQALEQLDYLQEIISYRLKLYLKLRKRVLPVLRDVKRLSKLSPAALSRATKQLVSFKKSFETQLGMERFLLFEYAYFDYVKVSQPPENAASTSQSVYDMQIQLTHFFTAAYKSLDRFIDKLRTVDRQIKLRRREVTGELTSDMFDSWLGRQEPGRANVWLARHPQQPVSSEQQQLLHRAQSDFENLLRNDAPSFKEKFHDTDTRLDSLIKQTSHAYQTADADKLQALADYLATSEEAQFRQVAVYALMAKSIVQQHWYIAIGMAEQIQLPLLISSKNKLLVKAYLAVGNLLASLPVLEALCKENTRFFAIYADIASQLGMVELAEFAYKMAVQTNSNDVPTFNEAKQWAIAHNRVELLAWLASLASS
jgi:hypothetical protein